MSGASGPRRGRVTKLRDETRPARQARAALKMMAVMQNKEPSLPTEFLVTGRTGRRNAMPDILDPPHAGNTTAGLPERLQQLATSDPDDPQPGSSGTSGTDPKKAAEQSGDVPQANS